MGGGGGWERGAQTHITPCKEFNQIPSSATLPEPSTTRTNELGLKGKDLLPITLGLLTGLLAVWGWRV